MEEAAELGNYLPQKDIEICLAFDLGGLADQPEIEGMLALHEALAVAYGSDNGQGAS